VTRRLLEIAAALVAAAFLVLLARVTRPADALAAAPFLAAAAWASAPLLVDALVPVGRARPTDAVPGGATATWTNVVHLGDEADDVAWTGIAMTATTGPTIVVTTRARGAVAAAVPAGVPVVVGATVGEAVRAAAERIDTPAALLLSPAAVPAPAGCRVAASLVERGAAWVTGRARTLNPDGYGPDDRDRLGLRLRNRARASGAVLWERDATMVRTALLRDEALPADRPWGHWLRRAARQGERGAVRTDVLAWRTLPSAAGSFWPTTVMRQRAAAADAAAAAATGPWRGRLRAVGLVARELFAYPLVLCLLAPTLIALRGDVPFALPAPFLAGAWLGAAVVRWAASRIAHGLPLRPRRDLAAAVFDVPGSLLALPSVCTRRVRPSRLRLPDRPLVWLALLVTTAVALPLVQGRAGEGGGYRLAAAVALVDLGLLWLFAVRALVRRRWGRRVWRMRVDAPACIDGRDVRTVDASADGVALTGDVGHLRPGDQVRVEVLLPDRSALAVAAVVSGRRAGRDGVVVGCRLRFDDADLRRRWARALAAVATAGRAGPAGAGAGAFASRPPRPARGDADAAPGRLGRVVAPAVLAVAGALSVAAVGALAVVLLGYRPVVVRSPSMAPALRVGDVALLETVPASALRPGDVVTLDDGRGDTLTHRVRAVRPGLEGRGVELETRGDANDTSERWWRPSDAPVGRVVGSVPRVGRLVAAVAAHRVALARATVGAAAAVAAVLALAYRRRARSTTTAASVDHGKSIHRSVWRHTYSQRTTERGFS